MPSMPSYLLESMILDYYDNIELSNVTIYPDIEFLKILKYIRDNIYSNVFDPKWIQWNINTMDIWDKSKIFTRAYNDVIKAEEARKLENDKKAKESINKWIEVFWPSFPNYNS